MHCALYQLWQWLFPIIFNLILILVLVLTDSWEMIFNFFYSLLKPIFDHGEPYLSNEVVGLALGLFYFLSESWLFMSVFPIFLLLFCLRSWRDSCVTVPASFTTIITIIWPLNGSSMHSPVNPCIALWCWREKAGEIRPLFYNKVWQQCRT